MRISDWSSDVCSSDLVLDAPESVNAIVQALAHLGKGNIDADVIGRFAARLDDAGTRALVAARSAMPGWMGEIVLKIQASRREDRKSVVEGKSVSVRVDLGARRLIRTHNSQQHKSLVSPIVTSQI